MTQKRVPTMAEVDLGYMAYEAEMQARKRHPLPRPLRDQDVRLPAQEPTPIPKVAERVFCPDCGRRFDQKIRKEARRAMRIHRRKQHPEKVDVAVD